ncbi:energy transducer TonB [Aurantivibrio plasticivorans]
MKNKSLLKPMLAAALYSLGVAATLCHASIKDFNDAVSQGDFKRAAQHTESIWRDQDKSQPSSATLAREFAFVNYKAGDFDTADYFIEQLSKRVVFDNQREVTRVLEELINYRRSSRASYLDRLSAALKRRLNTDGIDNISVIAADLLFVANWNQKRWEHVPKAADLAKKIYARGGDVFQARRHRADIFSIASRYVGKPRLYQFQAMDSIHNAIVADINTATPGPLRDELIRLKFLAQAWSHSMYGSYLSYNPGADKFIESSERRHIVEPSVPLFDSKPISNSKQVPESKQVFDSKQVRKATSVCDTELVTRNLRYPPVATFSGLMGAVIVRFEFDADGRATSSNILAAVPDPLFADSVREAVSSAHLKSVSGRAACQLPKSLVQTFSLVIQ